MIEESLLFARTAGFFVCARVYNFPLRGKCPEGAIGGFRPLSAEKSGFPRADALGMTIVFCLAYFHGHCEEGLCPDAAIRSSPKAFPVGEGAP